MSTCGSCPGRTTRTSEAATHYVDTWQSPRTYHPGLRGLPWWDAGSFDLVRRLEGAWSEPATRDQICTELDGLLADGLFERVFSPSALVVPGKVDAGRNGAEWSEFRLYETKSYRFDETKCAAIPTLAKLVRDPSDESRAHPEIKQDETVVSILSLDPGAQIMPHCGLTNRQLIMHFALRGSDGVEFTVAGETRSYGGDGHAIVFDDSFQHSVYHGGQELRYILFAMLRHPDAP
uniref:Aspartyl/asparaginy/proline hydroxylase domain-containing protein n=1 Tax=Alexandrium monilatum TaxID=311494 RepID=A0A7S4PY27_9DINO